MILPPTPTRARLRAKILKFLVWSIILLIFEFLVVAPLRILADPVTADSNVSNYLFSEDFEGPGFENTGWFKTGTPDEDYTTTPLHGAQSLHCLGGQYIYRSIEFSNSFYMYLMARWNTWGDYNNIIYWDNAGYGFVADLYANHNFFQIAHGSAFTSGTARITENTTYHIWLEWTKGTGSDGTMNLFVSTNGIKPALPDATITNGTGLATARMYIGPTGPGPDVIFDRILIDTVPIGNVTDSNQAPSISDIPDQTISQNGSTRPIPFVIGDAETDAASLQLTGTSSNAGLVPNSNIVFGGSGSNRTVTVTPAADQSGTTTITVTVSDGNSTASDTFKLTVESEGVLTVTADNASRTYGSANPTFTGRLAGLRQGDNITATFTTSATISSGVGSYAISPLLNDPDGKLSSYIVVTNFGTLTIRPALLMGQAEDKTRSYGRPNPLFTVVYSGFLNGDDASILTGTLAGVTPAETNSPPGIYPIRVSGQSAPNYTINYRDGTLTVTNALLFVEIANATRPYGAPNPPLNGNISGIENGDNITVAYATVANGPSPAGIYAVTAVVNDADGKLSNYTLVVQNGILTVSPASLTARADDKVRAFGASNPTLTGSLIGVQNGDNITARYTTSANSLSFPGDYPITPVLNDPDRKLGNYRITLQNGNLTVTLTPGLPGDNPPTLDVTADDKIRSYREANPVLTGTIRGLQSGDNITATYSTTATPDSPAAVYAITPTLHDPDGRLQKYKVSTHNGTLTVNPLKLSVSVDDKTRGYGAANPPLTGTITGLQTGDNISATYITTASFSAPVGNYPITPVFSDPDKKLGNYFVSVRNGTLSVIPSAVIRIASINLSNNQVHLTGSGDPNATYSIQTSSDLIHWNDAGVAIANGDGQFTFNGTDAASQARFFRVSR